MRIGIDISPAVNRPRAGIGRYVRSVVSRLLEMAEEDEYHLFFAGPSAAVPTELRRGNIVLRQLAGSARELRMRWLLSHTLGAVQRDTEKGLGSIDLFHSTDSTAPRLLGIPTVVTVHDLAFARFPETVKGMNRLYLSRMVEASVDRAAAVIADSEFTKSEVLSLLHLAANRVRVIHLGVEAVFQPAPEGTPPPRPFGWSEPYILAVGTLEPRKNLGMLLDAFAMVRGQLPGHRLVIVGSADFGAGPLSARLRALGLGSAVRLVGSISDADLAAVYRAAEFLVYPSKYEGFGLPPLEAMACGTPVLAARAASIPEVAGDAALLFDPDNTEELAAKMAYLAGAAARRQEMRSKGLERAAAFRWETAARSTREVYRIVCNST